ncbi:hypothetical protein [Tolypothrix sp. FACHB-123]|uniref:hypothetical protein n=1 Tax=Tolypothrix sp. FACHB-123 TaxID=2692868 RepID=UPI001A7F0F19|nr:hypothetical protein [Tolypothrix sp. FACHB-123]
MPNRPFCQSHENTVLWKTKYGKKFDFNKEKGCDVVPFRGNIYSSLQKILIFIAQNLQHGSIF